MRGIMEKKSSIEKILETIKLLNGVSDRFTERIINRLNNDLKELKYIGYINDILMVLDRNDLGYDKKNEIIKCINEYNEKFYNDELIKEQNYKKLVDKYKKSSSSSIVLPDMKNEAIIKPKYNITTSNRNIILDTACYFYTQINNNKYNLSKIEDILNMIDDNDRELVCKCIVLELKKEIIQMDSLLKDKDACYSKEEIEEFKDEILLYNELYSFINNYLSYKDEKLDINKDKKLLLFPQTKSDKYIFLSHLKSVPYEYYASFLNLIRTLENGVNLNFKKFYDHELFNGLMEIRGFQSRIIFDYFDKDVYIVVAAFVKKCYWDSKIKNLLTSAVSNYLSYKDSIKDILLSEEMKNSFYEEQSLICEEVKTYLKDNSREVR
jgi:hypothetical protein